MQEESGSDRQVEFDIRFWKWLSTYKDDVLGGTMATHFLSTTHLKAAWEAALEAAGKEGGDQS